MRLNSLLRQFKNNNEEYLKIRYAAKQAVRSVLSDNRRLLKIAILSLTESLRADPTKFNFLIHGTSSPLAMSKSNIIGYSGSNYHVIPSYYSNQNSHAETLEEVLVNEAANLYEKMVKEFTNETMTIAATGTNSNLLPSMIYLDEQTDQAQTLLAYKHITQTSVYDQ